MNDYSFDLNKLKIIINKLQESGVEEITPKNLENIYLKEVKIISETEEIPMTYSQTVKKVKDQINSLYQVIKQKGLSKEIYLEYVEKYLQIVMNKNVNRKTKIIALNKLEEEVQEYSNGLTEDTKNNIKK